MLCGVKLNKSPGPDNISARLLKAAAPTIARPLTDLFNMSMTQGCMPTVWKTANIKPIPKCAGASEPKDFRPIALTSIVSKCLERLVIKRLSPKLNDESQFAYKANRSTEDALLTLIDMVSEYLDKNAKNYARALFIDYTSAFNTINPKILIERLSYYDIHPNIVNWTYDFLTNRKQMVTTSKNTSKTIRTSTGSPQGCVLSPFLFSLYVAQMPLANDKINIIKYADDTVLIEYLSRSEPSTLQQEAHHLEQWCADNDLLLNAKKTKELVFSNAKDSPTTSPLVINNSDIEIVESFTYLGTVLTSKMDFTLNTDKTIKKARTRTHILAKLYHLGISNKIILTCYKSFIESILGYHLVVIFKHLKSDSYHRLKHLISTAEYLAGDQSFSSILDLYQHQLKSKSLRMVAGNHSNPVLTLNTLPSGRYQAVKHRIQLRSNCFRSQAIKFLNSVFR